MPLINYKSHLELDWTKDCVMSAIAEPTLKITITKLCVPIVTLSSKDNVKLVKLLEEGFERPVYWNEYQTKIETRNLDNNSLTRFPLDASFQGVRRLFVLAFNNITVKAPNDPINNTNNSLKKHLYKVFSSKSKHNKLQCTNRWKKLLWLFCQWSNQKVRRD